MYLTTYHGRIDTGKRLLPVVPRRYGRAVHAMVAERRRPRSVRTIRFRRKQRGGPHGKGLRSRDFVEDALRTHLVAAHTRRAPFPLRLETVTGDRPPNVGFCDRAGARLPALAAAQNAMRAPCIRSTRTGATRSRAPGGSVARIVTYLVRGWRATRAAAWRDSPNGRCRNATTRRSRRSSPRDGHRRCPLRRSPSLRSGSSGTGSR